MSTINQKIIQHFIMSQNQSVMSNKIIGRSNAAHFLDWSAPKFWKYVHEGKAPRPEIVNGFMVWDADVLLEWRNTYPFKNKGRPKKPAPSGNDGNQPKGNIYGKTT